jgi:uncharacterized membrane protein YkvA (DUF1232 family)
MPKLKVTFKLAESDLRHLRGILRKARTAASNASEEGIISAAEQMVGHVRVAKPPGYILERVEKLEGLIGMLKDVGWSMPAPVRQTALSALTYFVDPKDLIPDQIPGLGFLDDAIMIELVTQQLRHEIRGYDDFQRYRHTEWERPWHEQGAVVRDRKIAARRKAIRERIRAREKQEAERATGRGRRRLL